MVRDLRGVIRKLLPLVGDGVLFLAAEQRCGYVVRGEDDFGIVPAPDIDYDAFRTRVGYNESDPVKAGYLLLYAWVPGDGYRGFLLTSRGKGIEVVQSLVDPYTTGKSFNLQMLRRGIEVRMPIDDLAKWLHGLFQPDRCEAMRTASLGTLTAVFRREWGVAVAA